MEKYTTEVVLKKVQEDEEASIDDKIAEAEKTIISDDAFAICDFIEQLIKKAEHLRISSLMRR